MLAGDDAVGPAVERNQWRAQAMYEKMDLMSRELERLADIGKEEVLVHAPVDVKRPMGAAMSSSAPGFPKDEWDAVDDSIFEDTPCEEFEKNLVDVCKPMPWDIKLLGLLGEAGEDLLNEDYERVFDYFRNKHLKHDQQLISERTADRFSTDAPTGDSGGQEETGKKQKPKTPTGRTPTGSFKGTVSAMRAGNKFRKSISGLHGRIKDEGSTSPASRTSTSPKAAGSRGSRFGSNHSDPDKPGSSRTSLAGSPKAARTSTRLSKSSLGHGGVQLPAVPGATPRGAGSS